MFRQRSGEYFEPFDEVRGEKFIVTDAAAKALSQSRRLGCRDRAQRSRVLRLGSRLGKISAREKLMRRI
jgi:hypothetical protein